MISPIVTVKDEQNKTDMSYLKTSQVFFFTQIIQLKVVFSNRLVLA